MELCCGIALPRTPEQRIFAGALFRLKHLARNPIHAPLMIVRFEEMTIAIHGHLQAAVVGAPPAKRARPRSGPFIWLRG
jgi:hypothetical protein